MLLLAYFILYFTSFSVVSHLPQRLNNFRALMPNLNSISPERLCLSYFVFGRGDRKLLERRSFGDLKIGDGAGCAVDFLYLNIRYIASTVWNFCKFMGLLLSQF